MQENALSQTWAGELKTRCIALRIHSNITWSVISGKALSIRNLLGVCRGLQTELCLQLKTGDCPSEKDRRGMRDRENQRSLKRAWEGRVTRVAGWYSYKISIRLSIFFSFFMIFNTTVVSGVFWWTTERERERAEKK